MKNLFSTKFDTYACVNDSITASIDGIDYTATIHHDTEHHINDDDHHDENQDVTGCDDEQFAKLLKCRQAWFDDEWSYCGIIVTASKGGIELEISESLWGLEMNYPDSDNAYLTEEANNLLEQAIDLAPGALETMLETLNA